MNGIKSLPSLNSVCLRGCTALTDIDSLKDLHALEYIYVTGCTGLITLDALKSLPALKEIDISGCTGLTKESIAVFKAAHPKTLVIGP